MLYPEYLRVDIQIVSKDLKELKSRLRSQAEVYLSGTDFNLKGMRTQDPSMFDSYKEFVAVSEEQIERALDTLKALKDLNSVEEKYEEQEAQKQEEKKQYEEQLCTFFLVTIQTLESAAIAFEEQLISSEASISASPSSTTISAQLLGWIQKVKDWIKKNLKPKLKKVIQGGWKILANLLKPTSWSLKGGLGTGVLGLANVEMEITFGS
jgi:cysteinyl-tRNA synthetase